MVYSTFHFIIVTDTSLWPIFSKKREKWREFSKLLSFWKKIEKERDSENNNKCGVPHLISFLRYRIYRCKKYMSRLKHPFGRNKKRSDLKSLNKVGKMAKFVILSFFWEKTIESPDIWYSDHFDISWCYVMEGISGNNQGP